MGPIGQAVLIAAALAVGADPEPAVDPADFRGWFDEAAAGRLRIPAAVEARARRLRYVLVGGFRSERKPGYFTQNIKELETRGVPAAAIHTIYPSSHATAEENRDAIRAGFRAIAAAGPASRLVSRGRDHTPPRMPPRPTPRDSRAVPATGKGQPAGSWLAEAFAPR
jgi:hypothetical protein